MTITVCTRSQGTAFVLQHHRLREKMLTPDYQKHRWDQSLTRVYDGYRLKVGVLYSLAVTVYHPGNHCHHTHITHSHTRTWYKSSTIIATPSRHHTTRNHRVTSHLAPHISRSFSLSRP